MFLATLHTTDNTAALHIMAKDVATLEAVLVPYSNNPIFADAYEVYANAKGMPKLMDYGETIKLSSFSRKHHDAKLSDLRRYLPKHPGGRPRKPTTCKVCGKPHDSYTAAKQCCWKTRLEKTK